MKIHVWSTPRSGSTWYSEYLGLKNSCPVVHEAFNPNNLLYYKKNVDGKILEFSKFSDGCWHYIPTFDKNVLKKSFYPFESFTKRVEDWKKQYNLNFSAVWHNHPYPCVVGLDFFELTRDDVFVDRINKIEQIISYLIALEQMSFHRISGESESSSILISDLDNKLKMILNRFKLCKNFNNIQTVYYENINFDYHKNRLKNSVDILSRIEKHQYDYIFKTITSHYTENDVTNF